MSATPEKLEQLRAFRTPTIYDALERFDIRPRHVGYTDLSVRTVVDLGTPVVGYAWTAKIVGDGPETEGETVIDWGDVFAHVGEMPRPNIAVVEDLVGGNVVGYQGTVV